MASLPGRRHLDPRRRRPRIPARHYRAARRKRRATGSECATCSHRTCRAARAREEQDETGSPDTMTDKRRARVGGRTKESEIVVELDLDGTGNVDVDTGVPFY